MCSAYPCPFISSLITGYIKNVGGASIVFCWPIAYRISACYLMPVSMLSHCY